MIKRSTHNKLTDYFLLFAAFAFSVSILALALRGISGNPTATSGLNDNKWTINGPFELSPERGRFALLYSIVENHSFEFSPELGNFAQPDVAVNNGKYVSIFAPLLSFIAIPGYLIGRYLGISQVGSFATISIFALMNLLLIRAISIRLGASKIAATAAGAIFLFATPAFAYGVNLYQHHISTFFVLLSIFALLKSNKIWSLFIVFFLCAASIPLDYPNLFFMFPIGLFALGRIISFDKLRSRVSIKIALPKLLTIVIMIIPILFFLWYNQNSYGNPFQLSGTLHNAEQISNINPKDLQSIQEKKLLKKEGGQRSAVGFFQTRNILNGFYIHFVSPDRGVIYYAPIVLFGIIGLILAQKRQVKMVTLLVAIMGANILLYSMWGDPWGGWAFGSRYLIPSYAILSIFFALLLTYWNKKTWLYILILPILFYSIAVNTLGAITTSAIPPKVEVLELETLSGIVQRYTYQRNWEFLVAGHSKSFVYQTYLTKYMTPVQFYEILTLSIFTVISSMLIYQGSVTEKKGSLNV